VPEWDIAEDGLPRVDSYNLIEMIMSKDQNRLKGAINVSGKHVLEMKAMSDKSINSLDM
jgi:hypothetical protein